VGQAWCGGRQPPRRWYVDVSERRTSTSVATYICWIGLQAGVGRFFRDLTLAMILLAFHIFGLFPSVAQHQVNVDYLLLYWWIICYCTGGLFVFVLLRSIRDVLCNWWIICC
jgi:hypothetical protein